MMSTPDREDPGKYKEDKDQNELSLFSLQR